MRFEGRPRELVIAREEAAQLGEVAQGEMAMKITMLEQRERWGDRL